MLKILSKFEYVLNGTLLFMLAFVVLLATIDLGWIIVKDILTPPLFLVPRQYLWVVFRPNHLNFPYS